MDTITNNRRARNGGVILTDRLCTKQVAERIKILRPQMPRPVRQHHHGWRGDLLVQVEMARRAIQSPSGLALNEYCLCAKTAP